MGWLSRSLLGTPWPPEKVAGLWVDVSAPNLCGLAFGAPKEDLEARFGPATDYFLRRQGVMTYPRLGLILHETKNDGLHTFAVYGPAAAREAEGFRPFAGRFEPGHITEPLDEATLVSILAAPTRTTEKGGRHLIWDRPTSEVSAEFLPGGELVLLIATAKLWGKNPHHTVRKPM